MLFGDLVDQPKGPRQGAMNAKMVVHAPYCGPTPVRHVVAPTKKPDKHFVTSVPQGGFALSPWFPSPLIGGPTR